MARRRHDPSELAQQHLAAIVQDADDAIISKNLESIVTSWNPAAERIFGYTAEEMIGQSILRIIPADLASEETDFIDRIRRGERVVHHETRRLRKDGKTIHVSLTVSPIRDADGEIIGASKIARDIADKKILEQQAADALEDARRARYQAELASRAGAETVIVVEAEGSLATEPLRQLAGVGRLESETIPNGTRLRITTAEARELTPRLCDLAVKQGWKLRELRPQRQSLEEMFVRIVEAEEPVGA